ncbi:MAG TPA: GIY-YIG nuclease family protein [Terriglobales bacterium]
MRYYDPRGETFLYVVHVPGGVKNFGFDQEFLGHTEFVSKVGVTNNLVSRLSSLQSDMRVLHAAIRIAHGAIRPELFWAAKLPTRVAALQIERNIKLLYAGKGWHGFKEWFTVNPESLVVACEVALDAGEKRLAA